MYQNGRAAGASPTFRPTPTPTLPYPGSKSCTKPPWLSQTAWGWTIATRADCLSQEVCDYLAQLNRRCWLLVELGLHPPLTTPGKESTAATATPTFWKGMPRLKQRGIQVCIHLINGLPGEDHRRMVENVRRISHLGMYAVKLHLLYFLKGTQMAEEYRQGRVQMMSREEYVQVVCDQLELLPPETVIHRLTGDGKKEELIGPLWSLKKFCVLNEIDKELVRRDSWQGKNYSAGESGKLGGF